MLSKITVNAEGSEIKVKLQKRNNSVCIRYSALENCVLRANTKILCAFLPPEIQGVFYLSRSPMVFSNCPHVFPLVPSPRLRIPTYLMPHCGFSSSGSMNPGWAPLSPGPPKGSQLLCDQVTRGVPTQLAALAWCGTVVSALPSAPLASCPPKQRGSKCLVGWGPKGTVSVDPPEARALTPGSSVAAGRPGQFCMAHTALRESTASSALGGDAELSSPAIMPSSAQTPSTPGSLLLWTFLYPV